MRNQTNKAEALLSLIRRGEHMTFKQQLELTIRLSIPAVVAQISYIVMQYIDASMVGSLGAEASASIGLVSTSTWLFWGSMCCFCYGLFCAGSTSYRSERIWSGTCCPSAVFCCNYDIQLTADCNWCTG